MPPTLRTSRPPHTGGWRFTRWDALVAFVLGAGLLAAGWADWKAYRVSHVHNVATFGLIGQTGDTRIGGDEFFQRGAIILHLHNVGAVEHDGDQPFRQALGPTLTIESWSTLALQQVDFVLDNSFPSQDITVAQNGEVLEQIHAGPGRIERSYHVPLRRGGNQFTLTFAVYNHHGAEYEGSEERPLAGTLRYLDVHF